jgi:hypothetical protein
MGNEWTCLRCDAEYAEWLPECKKCHAVNPYAPAPTLAEMIVVLGGIDVIFDGEEWSARTVVGRDTREFGPTPEAAIRALYETTQETP